MDEKMLFASSAKLASLKAAKPSRAKGRKRWMCHHPWASVAFIKQTEREIQGLKGITDSLWAFGFNRQFGSVNSVI